jgi:hypothetical protein
MKKLSYQEKLNLIKEYTSLGINSRKYYAKNPNYTRTEKWLISRYYNVAKESGYFDIQKGRLIPKVKIVKSKKKKEKGSPRFKGYFIPSARPGDIVRGNKIIHDNYIKEFIPLNLKRAPLDEDKLYPFIFKRVSQALEPHKNKLKRGTYFTIVLINDLEVGQLNRKSTQKQFRQGGQPFSRDLSGEKKIEDISGFIFELMLKARLEYDVKKGELIKGLFFWQFVNQRKPKNKERKIARKRKRK